MSLRADLVGLVGQPYRSLPEIDRRRRLPAGLLALALSILVPALLAEVVGMAPFRPPAQLDSTPSLTAQGLDIYARWVYQHRFTIPAIGALLSLLAWLAAAVVIHLGARALKGTGSLAGLIKLAGFISLTGLVVLPISLMEAGARFSPNPSAGASLASLASLVGFGVFIWQNLLLVLAARAHYGLSTGRAVTAVVGPLGCLLGLGLALVVLAIVAAVLVRPSGSL